MRTYFFFAILIMGFFAAITAAVRPELIENKYLELRAPIDQYFSEKHAKTWAEAKESDRAKWMLKLRLPAYCTPPHSSLRELECNAIIKTHEEAFEKSWNEDVRNGWKPQGTED